MRELKKEQENYSEKILVMHQILVQMAKKSGLDLV